MIIYYTDKFTGGREESRRLLQDALTVYTGDAEQAKMLIRDLKKGEHGKPYIEGFSCFSISHTGSIWAVLFADRECGLDMQISRKCDIIAISERFFNPEDAAVIASSEDEAGDAFFRVWARREALVKAIGGSVADTDLPAVLTEKAVVNGKHYFITDIGISAGETTYTELPDKQKLYAALCVEGYAIETWPEIYRL